MDALCKCRQRYTTAVYQPPAVMLIIMYIIRKIVRKTRKFS